MKGNLVIITSPSGGGKGTLIREILSRVPDIGYSVSFTTRAKREGEVDGRDYYFVSASEFELLIQQDEFLEFAEVHGNFYGTSVKKVLAELELGRDVILEIDVQGAENILQKYPEAVSIFILPPSFETLKNRLTGRGTEKPADLAVRLRNSVSEVNLFHEFRYVVVNDEVEAAVRRLEHIILAERLTSVRQTTAIQGILDSFNTSILNDSGE